jgi:hypothetical protein
MAFSIYSLSCVYIQGRSMCFKCLRFSTSRSLLMKDVNFPVRSDFLCVLSFVPQVPLFIVVFLQFNLEFFSCFSTITFSIAILFM